MLESLWNMITNDIQQMWTSTNMVIEFDMLLSLYWIPHEFSFSHTDVIVCGLFGFSYWPVVVMESVSMWGSSSLLTFFLLWGFLIILPWQPSMLPILWDTLWTLEDSTQWKTGFGVYKNILLASFLSHWYFTSIFSILIAFHMLSFLYITYCILLIWICPKTTIKSVGKQFDYVISIVYFIIIVQIQRNVVCRWNAKEKKSRIAKIKQW